MSLFSLKGKYAIITGGGSGIGEAIAMLFAKQGAMVYIFDFNEESGKKVADAINAENEKAIALKCDVSSQKEVIETINSIAKKNNIDILVNNAGISHIGKLDTTSEGDFDRVFAVNVKGFYNTMYACIPHMKKNGSGVILNMASVVSEVGIPDRFAYSMSKGAVKTMTLSVATDYLADNIRCNCIMPARVHTPFVDNFLTKNYPGKEKVIFEKLSKSQPIGRMGKPEEIAYLTLYLCSDEASFITGSSYAIDGGFINLVP